MAATLTYSDKPGLRDHLRAAGFDVACVDAIGYLPLGGAAVQVQAAIDAFTDSMALAAAKAQRQAALVQEGLSHESAGTLATMPDGSKLHVETTPDVRSNLAAAWASVQIDAAYTVHWRNSDGSLGEAAGQAVIEAAAKAAGEHVAACRVAEAGHAAAIDALTVSTTVLAYDFTAGWPA